MTENKKRIEDALQSFIEEYNKSMEGTIRTDENGFRWIFRNGRWEAMCVIEPVSFEQRLRDNPMPTKTLDNENYNIIEVRYERKSDLND